MDRKEEIKKDLWQILKQVYTLNEEKGITNKQEEFLEKAVQYLDANISLRRKIVKEKAVEKQVVKEVNPDSAKWGD